MSKKKIIIAATGTALLLLFVFVAVMLFRGIKQFGVAEKNLANARTQLNNFYRKDPFPSEKNIDIVRGNADQLDEWIDEIIEVAKRKQVDPAETRSPSVFINTLTKVRNELQSKSRGAVTIDEEFGFGFDRYVEGQPATAAHVPRLMQQLFIVNEICDILIEEEVDEITSLEREQFEGIRTSGGDVRSARSRRTSRRGTRDSSGSSTGGKRVSALPPDEPNKDAGIFAEGEADTKIKFSVDFTAKEDVVLNVLNRLAQNEMFVVVTVVDIEVYEPESAAGESASADTASSSRTRTGGLLSMMDSEDPKAETSDEQAGLNFRRVKSREERVIYGGKVEKPSRVHLELEVYRFK